MSEIRWEDPFSPEGQREATAKILTGINYRLFFEGVTRRKLIKTYRELTALANNHPNDEKKWRDSLREIIKGKDKNLRYWLVGLTAKTAKNLGHNMSDLPVVFDQVMDEIGGGGGARYGTFVLGGSGDLDHSRIAEVEGRKAS